MSFTEIKAEELKDNPFDLIGKQWMLITAGNEEKCNTMTASWGGVGIMWGKPTATAYIRDSRYLWTEKIILHWHSLEKSIEKR